MKRISVLTLSLLLLIPQLAVAQSHIVRRPTAKPKVEVQKVTPKQNTAAKPTAKAAPKQAPKLNYSTEQLSDETFTVNGVSFVMKGVQGGEFSMGATPEQGNDVYDDEKPVHRVAVSSFRIGQTAVTQALWKAVMGRNPSYYKGDNRPVESVNWYDCQEFIGKLNALTGKNFRLPTEAEWEYAARGGNKSRGYKFSGSNLISEVGWYTDNSSTTHDVASKAPNELGLYDMSGNVYEWCNDWSGKYSPEDQVNPQGPASGSSRVYRGGSYGIEAKFSRVSLRASNTPDFRNTDYGLRLAL